MLITAKEVAKRLSVAPKTVRKWARLGRIPVTALPGNNLRFDEVVIQNWIEKRTTKVKHYSSIQSS